MAVLGAGFAFFLLEAVLFVATLATPSAEILLSSPTWGGALRAEEDPVLGRRPAPDFPGHDARGFRNPEAYSSPKVVAFGDSQTYGTSVSPLESWPRKLEEILGESVYSMALGGYSPVQGLLLWEEARELRPEVVVQAVYLGNDLPEAFFFLHGEAPRQDLRVLYRPATSSFDGPRVEQLRTKVQRSDRKWKARREQVESPLRRLLRSRSWGLARRVKMEVGRSLRDPDHAWQRISRLDNGATQLMPWESAGLRTVFDPELRLEAIDPSHPANSEGVRIVRETLVQLSTKVASHGSRFVVVLIPTKERVFEPWIEHEEGSAKHDKLRTLIEEESLLARNLLSFLEAEGIEAVDSVDALRDVLERGAQPYYSNEDGHPNAHGQEAIARAVATKVVDLSASAASVGR